MRVTNDDDAGVTVAVDSRLSPSVRRAFLEHLRRVADHHRHVGVGEIVVDLVNGVLRLRNRSSTG
jgi:hypothetical protein